jgi:hypothetical protein
MGMYNTEKDFIQRSIEIVRQYDVLKNEIPPKQQYEETMFVNFLMGLLIVTKEEYLAHIPKGFALTTVAGVQIDLTKLFFIQLRNAIAHYNFKLLDKDNDERIDSIEFKNIGVFKLDTFKPFILDFAQQLHDAIPP